MTLHFIIAFITHFSLYWNLTTHIDMRAVGVDATQGVHAVLNTKPQDLKVTFFSFGTI
jgi:hypothetical protein